MFSSIPLGCDIWPIVFAVNREFGGFFRFFDVWRSPPSCEARSPLVFSPSPPTPFIQRFGIRPTAITSTLLAVCPFFPGARLGGFSPLSGGHGHFPGISFSFGLSSSPRSLLLQNSFLQSAVQRFLYVVAPFFYSH